ncbi:MAG: thiamine phosphate synthase [Candidatus Beckwithbacteria bacterium]|nr:thiamine phosphate synthase [Candidatus Beckwithbacteria bacterium]
MKPIITPTFFINSLSVLKDRLELYEGIEGITRIQLDPADESFTANPTLSVETMVKQPTTLKRDVHLMVEEPIDWLEICRQEGVNMVIGHIENMSSQEEFIKEARRLSLKVGLAVDLETDFNELEWLVAKEADLILVMTVRAGQEQQKFSAAALERVKLLRKKGFIKEICVDGGVNEVTIKDCVRAGADVLAIGSALWKAANVKQQLGKLMGLAYEI